MTYQTLAEAEAALLGGHGTIGHGKIHVARVVKAIREDELYREHLDEETGEPVVSFDAYLACREEEFRRLSGLGARRVRSLLKSYLLFVDQLERSEDWLLGMGEHAYILAEAANTESYVLQPHDTATPTGKKLGAERFAALVEEVEQLVAEGVQRVNTTKDLVAEIVGRKVPVELSKVARCLQLDNERAKIQGLRVTFNGIVYSFGGSPDVWALEDLKAWSARDGIRLEGLADEETIDTHTKG